MFVNDLAVSAIMSGVIEVHVIAYSVAASAVLQATENDEQENAK